MRKIVTMLESKQMDQNTFGSYRIQQNPRISVTFNHGTIQYVFSGHTYFLNDGRSLDMAIYSPGELAPHARSDL